MYFMYNCMWNLLLHTIQGRPNKKGKNTFIRVFFGQIICHFQDDSFNFSRVLLDAQLLFGVEVRLDRFAEHDLR